MLHPKQFRINKTWILFQLNDAQVLTDRNGDFNVVALMDAASGFIFDTGVISAGSDEMSEIDAKRLLKNGYSHKKKYPKELIIPKGYMANNLKLEAERCGIRVKIISEDQLQNIIGEARKFFQGHL